MTLSRAEDSGSTPPPDARGSRAKVEQVFCAPVSIAAVRHRLHETACLFATSTCLGCRLLVPPWGKCADRVRREDGGLKRSVLRACSGWLCVFLFGAARAERPEPGIPDASLFHGLLLLPPVSTNFICLERCSCDTASPLAPSSSGGRGSHGGVETNRVGPSLALPALR